MEATTSLPIVSESTGYTLTCMARTAKGNQRTHWTAIWRTPAGNFLHQALPLTIDEAEGEAIAYAMTCPETW